MDLEQTPGLTLGLKIMALIEAAKEDQSSAEANLDTAKALKSSGNPDRAIPYYVAVADLLEPDNPDANLALGNIYYNAQDYPEAVQYLTKAVELDHENKSALGRLGYALMRLGRYDEAADVFDHALELDLNDPTILNNRGYIHIFQEDYEGAIVLFDRILAQYENDIAALNNRGYALLQIGEATRGNRKEILVEGAICLENALDLAKDDTERIPILANLGEYYRLDGDSEAAIEYYTRALDTFDQLQKPDVLCVSAIKAEQGLIALEYQDSSPITDAALRSGLVTEEQLKPFVLTEPLQKTA